ncbi:MAG: hypothetical protein H7X95_05670 [Deltaproteobacteria bacterium]|nr:hypothetical protein [Deltaproteobacteria bacterium]
MAFTSSIPDGFQLQYSDEWTLGLAQRASRLEAYIDVEPISGESKRFQRIGPATSRRITERFGKSNPDDVNAEYRWLDVHFDKAVHRLSRIDALMLGSLGSPHNAVLRSHLQEAGRQMDATIIQGCIGGVRAGKTGGTTITLPAEQAIAVNFVDSGTPANSGMTFAKLLEIATMFGVDQVTGQDIEDHSQACVIVSPRQVKNLLNEQKLTSSDFGLQRLMTGEVVNAFGLAIKSVAPHLLPYDSGTDIRTCVAFAREAMVFGMVESPMSRVDDLIEGDYDVQIYSSWGWGACRKIDEGVITIACDESP